MTPEITLLRYADTGDATLGVFRAGKRVVYTLEDSWRDNQPKVSCIPAGTYHCVPHGWEPNSPVKRKRTWEITGVPGRSAVLIHAGNRPADTEGCILVGLGVFSGALTSSADALGVLRAIIGANPFTLTIRSLDDISVAA
ncbi:DUF5675 family protein [Mesorhizobium sp. B2-3-4]|uniref:DUF5675 family protein n=1 Tax=Mesorhizobium sp. B2-3-4 TaxID=2589959 RepID=UPI001128D85F|nr:DUF5675 family protein [Mesorhizobium sp. B2-3-4]TPM41426.1 hypothetical protein FJ967_00365 [Mesorhizobium sp. B2-3-4]